MPAGQANPEALDNARLALAPHDVATRNPCTTAKPCP